jgi:hypothetical protein
LDHDGGKLVHRKEVYSIEEGSCFTHRVGVLDDRRCDGGG